MLEEILEWSASRPDWQRDALRRIVAAGELTDTDLTELHAICRAKAAGKTNGAVAVPFDKSHLPAGPTALASVTLVSLGNLSGVNRLPATETISFGGGHGLTVIYGDNGAGKSGYARVLRKACRSRGAMPTIRPNAFGVSAATVPEATLLARADGIEFVSRWRDGVPADRRLSNVFIFDTSCAQTYLAQDGPASFTPYGLDILPQLSRASDELRLRMERERDLERSYLYVTPGWHPPAGTEVARLVSDLGPDTKAEEIDALATFHDTDSQRLGELSVLLRTDATRKEKETRAAVTRLVQFAAGVQHANTHLSDQAISVLRELSNADRRSDVVARMFGSGLDEPPLLAGTGEESWRQLWEAARTYSQSKAYRGRAYPVLDVGSACVLCQTLLDPSALARLQLWESIHQQDAGTAGNPGSLTFRLAMETFNRIEALAPEFKKVEADLGALSSVELESIRSYVYRFDEILRTMRDCLAGKSWVAIPVRLPSPEFILNRVIAGLQARAREEGSADDPKVRQQLMQERLELEGREWLARNRAEVLIRLNRHKKLAELTSALTDTTTRAITAKNSDLTKRIVSDTFCERFAREASSLGLKTLSVKLEEIKGVKGETSFGLRLHPQTRFGVGEVASEGEQRCIAMAAFLAELSQATHQSAVVFDDPVSSLDHDHRERIARRLCEEAQARQVIVFTHDTVFLDDLCTCAEKGTISASYLHLAWNGNQPGHCHAGLPWDSKRPEERIDALEKTALALERNWGPKPSPENISEMRNAYSKLRQTLERIVERVVFSNVVIRFRSYVDFRNLTDTVGFCKKECDELLRLYGKCCDVTDAHDWSQAKQRAIPDPTNLKTDIAATLSLLRALRARKKSQG